MIANQEQPSIVISATSPVEKMQPPPQPAGGGSRSSSPTTPYDESFQAFQQNLNMICRRSGRKQRFEFPVPSPVCRPKSEMHVNNSPLLITVSSQDSAARYIRVRHEETEERLRQSLTMICLSPKVSPSFESEQSATGCEKKKSTGLSIRESLKTGIRIKVNISEYSWDRIVVSIDRENILNVYYLGGNDVSEKILHSVKITAATSVQSIACNVIDGGSLYIRERAKESTVIDFVGFTKRFLPIVKLDESSLRFEISLHVPKEVYFEEIGVKTVDSRLVIKGNGVEATSFKDRDGSARWKQQS